MEKKLVSNPLSMENYSDPFITYDKVTGYYYFIASCQSNDLIIFRSKNAANLIQNNDFKVVFTCGHDGVFGPMWAPEMYKIDGLWYIYTSCQERANDNPFGERKTLLVLKSISEDPFDGFEFASKPDPNEFAIDPTSTFIGNKQYLCYSVVRGTHQLLEIREMLNPTTFSKEGSIISQAFYDWEKVPGYDVWTINEGPFFLKKDNRIFIIYSANGCWSDDYCLGLLEFQGGEVCNANNWKKHTKPIFIKGSCIFGVGHASFFNSPDDKEVWIAYHCLLRSNPTLEEMDRQTCIQRINFDKTGFPIIGEPIGTDTKINPPSGE